MELFFLILLFVIGSLLQAAGKNKRRRDRLERSGEPEDAGQPDLMAEIRKAIEQLKEQRDATGSDSGRPRFDNSPLVSRSGAGARPASPLELDEEVEDTESLEVEPEVRSLETTVTRPARVEFDQDDGAEALVASRIRWAEDHGKRKTMAEHRAFDEAVRAAAGPAPRDPAADARAVLRKRIIWNEILGKPLALRDKPRQDGLP